MHICSDSDIKTRISSSPHGPLTRYRARYLKVTAMICVGMNMAVNMRSLVPLYSGESKEGSDMLR